MILLPHRTVVWRATSFTVCIFVFFVSLYDYRFLSGGKSYGRKILHARWPTIRTGLLPFGEDWLAVSHGGGISGRPGVGSADHAGRHLWLLAGVESAVRAVVIYGYDGRWTLGIAGGAVAEGRMMGYASCKPADALVLSLSYFDMEPRL